MSSEYYFVRLLKPVKAGAPGIFDGLCQPLIADAPAGKRVRMYGENALEAARNGHVEMLSPGPRAILAKEKETANKKPTKKDVSKKGTYRTRVEIADVDA